MRELFRGHNNLIFGLNALLSKGYEITVIEDDGPRQRDLWSLKRLNDFKKMIMYTNRFPHSLMIIQIFFMNSQDFFQNASTSIFAYQASLRYAYQRYDERYPHTKHLYMHISLLIREGHPYGRFVSNAEGLEQHETLVAFQSTRGAREELISLIQWLLHNEGFALSFLSQRVDELVHLIHLQCLLGRGCLIDSACDDSLIQAALLTLLPANFAEFHSKFHVKSSNIGKSINSALAAALETQLGTLEEPQARPASSDVSGSSKSHLFKPRDRQDGKRKNADRQDDDNTTTVQSQLLMKDAFKIRQMRKARAANTQSGAASFGSVQTGSASYGSGSYGLKNDRSTHHDPNNFVSHTAFVCCIVFLLEERENTSHKKASLFQVEKATENFSDSNKIGEGRFGPVYKGVLEDGLEVAVKRISKTSDQGFDEFKNELISIAKLQHWNLVKLIGYCIFGDEMILIHEYMSNKSVLHYVEANALEMPLAGPSLSHYAWNGSRDFVSASRFTPSNYP
ncbi:G-type lectin S-receptor-like serine/threonine-protein kinase [Tanacetum coccineum]